MATGDFFLVVTEEVTWMSSETFQPNEKEVHLL